MIKKLYSFFLLLLLGTFLYWALAENQVSLSCFSLASCACLCACGSTSSKPWTGVNTSDDDKPDVAPDDEDACLIACIRCFGTLATNGDGIARVCG